MIRWYAALAAVAAFAQQPQDEDFAKAVREWTTKPEFLSPLVDHLPKSSTIPSPKSFLGYHAGAPNKLTYYRDIVRYFRALEQAAPDRMKVVSAGKTDEGRECVTAFFFTGGFDDVLRHRARLAQLADPRPLSDAQAKEIVAQTKPIYHITGGLHSTETGSPEMLMELAYRLLVEDGPLFDAIRKNLIVAITPVLEPDGQERFTDWYYRHLVHEKTEDDRMPGPPYWGKYTFHDNNRDSNYSQVTMRNWLKQYLEWHPPIVHDLHESLPLLYTFSGQPPQNPNLDPILYSEMPWFAHHELSRMTSMGMPGVWTHAFVDTWSVGYLGFMASNHNGMLRMYETFGNRGANTMMRTLDPPDSSRPGLTKREWYRPMPLTGKVEWSHRNNTNYMQTGVLVALELASANAPTIVENFYRKSRNGVEAGKKEAPFGWTIPAGQIDPTRVAFVVNTLRLQGIEVGRRADGTFVVRRDQPYGRLAKSLLEKQTFPDANLRTYDDTGWTMGLMAGIEVKEIADRKNLDEPSPLIDRYDPEGRVEGTGEFLTVPHNGSNHMIALRYRLKKQAVEATADGSLVLPNTPAARTEIAKLGLTAKASAAKPAGPLHNVDLPRLAVFSRWGRTQETGWVRHAFDHFGVEYDLIFKERVRQGNLRASYDVIVVPQMGNSAKEIVQDVECKDREMPYTKSSEHGSLGMYGESANLCGGIGLAGLVEIEKFVAEGGRLITLGGSSALGAELLRHVDAGRAPAGFYAPGPIVEAEVLKPAHPVFYGYPGKILPVRYSTGPIFSITENQKANVTLLRFSGTEKSVLSGLMNRPADVKDKAAIVDAPLGAGRILLFAINPCYRWQNYREFNLLFNAVMHWNDWN
jgi:hypothetical protein